MFGLQQKHIDAINQCFAQYPQIEQVTLYGSRATGNYKNGSDIDLTIVGDLDYSGLLRLENQLEDLLLPYKMDLSLKHKITNPDLLEHIERVGKVFYEKEKQMAVHELRVEYGRKPSEWKTYKLADFVEINPRVPLKQGNEYSFVEMKDLDATFKYVSPSVKRELKGGSKFQNGDTLFARITPCLENGKICQVRNLENNVGFGSTEFLIFRGKENVSDNDFVYYLSRSEFVKNNAIQMMTGTSGRQRVEKSALEQLEISVPDLATQRQIAQILSSLDDKIELNLQMNQTLEAMAQAIFKEWFVNFNFPGFDGELVDGLPKGWRKMKLTDLISTVSITHKFPKGEAIFLNTSDILDGKFLHKNYSQKDTLPGQAKKTIQKGDILFTEIRPANRRYAYVDFEAEDYVVSTKLMVLRSKGVVDNLIVYYFMKSDEVLHQLQTLAESRSGTFPQITYDELAKVSMPIPDLETLTTYTEFLSSIFSKARENEKQIEYLTQTRDTLIPKLISGQITVK